jgi:hypothetical protein
MFAYGVIALVSTSAPGIAQIATGSAWPPPVGVRARLISPILGADRTDGVIEGVTGDTLQFRRVGAATAVTLRPNEITKLEVPTGTHTAKAKWFAIGLVAGAAMGGFVGAGSYTPPPCADVLTCIAGASVETATGRSAAAAAGGLLGAVTGGLAGLWWGNRPRQTWTAVPVPAP